MPKKGLYLVLMTAFISGLSIFINKFGVSGISPFLFTGAKNLVVGLFLLSLLLLTKEIKHLKTLNRREWLNLITIGIIGGSIPFLLFFKGLTLTSAVQASFIHKNMFLIVALLAPIFLREKLNKNFIIGGALLLLGNALLLSQAFPFSWNLGNTFILGATIFWALENIISKKILISISPNIVAWARMFFGSTVILAYLTFTGQIQLASSLNTNQWLWVGLTALFLFGYVYTWYNGLKEIKVSVATAILTLGAPITTLLSLLTGSTLTNQQLVGILSITAGIVLLISFQSVINLIKKRASTIYAGN